MLGLFGYPLLQLIFCISEHLPFGNWISGCAKKLMRELVHQRVVGVVVQV